MASSWLQVASTWVIRRSRRWVSVDDVVQNEQSTINTCAYDVDIGFEPLIKKGGSRSMTSHNSFFYERPQEGFKMVRADTNVDAMSLWEWLRIDDVVQKTHFGRKQSSK